MSLAIGNVTLSSPVILSPMAGVSDLPFRLLCHEMGASLVCTEMVSAKAIYYGNKNTEELMAISPEERPVSLQLFGSDPSLMADMAQKIEERPFDILDINMGCPVPKVVKNGDGSALMRNPDLAGRIIRKVSDAVKKPVTVKIRKGFNEEEVNAVTIAKIAEDSGASAIIIHGRTREQMYSGTADWEIIRKVKEAVKIPVIGNGDVTSATAAKRMMDTTGCDGVAIGRAARGNPWIFREVRFYLLTGVIPPRPTGEEVLDMMLRQARMEVELKGEYTGIRQMRTHASWYTAGYPNSAALRARINQVETLSELEEVLKEGFALSKEGERSKAASQ